MATHEEWFGRLVQAVTAVNQGDHREAHRLAHLLAKGEEAGVTLEDAEGSPDRDPSIAWSAEAPDVEPAALTDEAPRGRRQRYMQSPEAEPTTESSTPAE